MVARFLPAALAALLALFMVNAPAIAATSISQTVSIPLTIASRVAPGATSPISFNRFNPTLGTLLGVTLSFEAVSDTMVRLSNSTTSQQSWQVTPGGSASLSGNGFTLSSSYSDAASTLVLGPRLPSGAPRTLNLGSPGFYSDSDTLTAGLAPFIGAGAVEFTFAALNQWIVNGTGGDAIFDPDAYTGSATIAYSYELPAGLIPEPATWGLLIAGFVLVGLTARRRRAVTLS